MEGWGGGPQIDTPLAIMTSLRRKIETFACVANGFTSAFVICPPRSLERCRPPSAAHQPTKIGAMSRRMTPCLEARDGDTGDAFPLAT